MCIPFLRNEWTTAGEVWQSCGDPQCFYTTTVIQNCHISERPKQKLMLQKLYPQHADHIMWRLHCTTTERTILREDCTALQLSGPSYVKIALHYNWADHLKWRLYWTTTERTILCEDYTALQLSGPLMWRLYCTPTERTILCEDRTALQLSGQSYVKIALHYNWADHLMWRLHCTTTKRTILCEDCSALQLSGPSYVKTVLNYNWVDNLMWRLFCNTTDLIGENFVVESRVALDKLH